MGKPKTGNTVKRWWRRIDPARFRSLVTEVNDGIIAVAGLALGLAGADTVLTSAEVIVLISSAVGAMSVFGVRLGEQLAEREAQLSLIEEEQRLLELSPEEEIQELVTWFEARGVTSPTARTVAEEMSGVDALAAQLHLVYGIPQVTTTRDAFRNALWAGFAFLLGSSLPLLATYLTSSVWREEHTVLTAALALTITSALLALLGRSRFWHTALRTLALGLGTLTITYILGDILV